MVQYSRKVAFDLIDKTRKWNAMGCHAWSLLNVGNVNVTINGVLILKEDQDFEGPAERPDTRDDTDLDIEFDATNAPTKFAATGGTDPRLDQDAIPGGPTPGRDTRLLIVKSFLSKI
ncbi:MAG: hypothetical protein H7258_05360 [Ferruginibacter sp.]|nr:hypothetical protein [Ferruginibacter sp.]